MSQQLSASLQRKQGSARQQQQLFLRAVLEMGGASRGAWRVCPIHLLLDSKIASLGT